MSTEQALTVRAADTDFCARQRGDDPTAIFLHGFGSDLRIWDSLWSALGNDFSALRYDLRGFGCSTSNSDDPFSHTDDLLAILDVKGIERCDLVGVSMGGAVVLNFALDNPQRVRKLILISPGMVAWEWSEHWRTLWRPIVECAREGDMDKARRLWWEHPLFDSTRERDAARVLYESIQRYSGAQWVRDNQQASLPDIERLHTLVTPTLLLTGGRDLEDFRLIAQVIEASAQNLTRVDWPELGHLLQLEHPAACAAQLQQFMRCSRSL